jgi:hypothetical protein
MENQLLEHRRHQRATLEALIKNLQAEIKGNTLHLHALNKEKTELND